MATAEVHARELIEQTEVLSMPERAVQAGVKKSRVRYAEEAAHA
jgi:hypothetical protein